jgi:ABC-type amino acid transport substrate-binding protein
MDAIVETLNSSTTYEFYLSPDSFYGRKSNGSWNGIVKETLDGNADLTLADFTITAERYGAIDFIPYIDSSLSLLVYQNNIDVSLWEWLSPFTPGLWLTLIATTMFVSIMIWITETISPYGYRNSKLVSEIDRFDYSSILFNSLLIFVGSAENPGRSWSSKIMIFGYMTVTLIVLSFYSSNLSAILTVQRATTKVHGLEDLRKEGTIFGVLKESSVQSYFEKRAQSVYRRHMVLYPTKIELVSALYRGEIDATVSAKSTQEFLTNQPPCDKFLVGSDFHKQNFGIGINHGNEKTATNLSLAILKLEHQGIIAELYGKWWDNNCPRAPVVKGHLEVSNLFGAFAFLSVGLLISTIIIVFEGTFYHYYTQKLCIGPWSKQIHKFLGYTHEEGASKKIDKTLEPILSDNPNGNDIQNSVSYQNGEEKDQNGENNNQNGGDSDSDHNDITRDSLVDSGDS